MAKFIHIRRDGSTLSFNGNRMEVGGDIVTIYANGIDKNGNVVPVLFSVVHLAEGEAMNRTEE